MQCFSKFSGEYFLLLMVFLKAQIRRTEVIVKALDFFFLFAIFAFNTNKQTRYN